MKVPVTFPSGAELLVKAGQMVDFSTPFLKKKGKKSIKIPLSELLHFKPEKIFMVLKKVVGDRIAKGDLLAESKAFLSTKQYMSSVDGLIKEIDHLAGTISIELEGDDDIHTTCFFIGEIDAIHADHLELKVKRAHKLDIKPSSHYLGGEVYYVVDVEKPLTEENVIEKCICGEKINPLDHSKLNALGAKALITNSDPLLQSDIRHFTLQNPGDLEVIMKEHYPFCITGIDGQTIFFYE
jgi:hypothetical protein